MLFSHICSLPLMGETEKCKSYNLFFYVIVENIAILIYRAWHRRCKNHRYNEKMYMKTCLDTRSDIIFLCFFLPNTRIQSIVSRGLRIVGLMPYVLRGSNFRTRGIVRPDFRKNELLHYFRNPWIHTH